MNSPRLFPLFLLLLLLASLAQLDAQVGNNNPTGVSGIFNGNVTPVAPTIPIPATHTAPSPTS